MASVGGDRLLTDISIPGTHDSCTYKSSFSVSKCQTYDLMSQLNSGVRYLDIRVKLEDSKLKIYHGIEYLDMTLTDVLSIVKEFLDTHPSECILIRIQKENDGGPDAVRDTAYQIMLQTEWTKAGLEFRDSSTIPDFRLDANRGKTLIVEYNNLTQNDRTYNKITGYSYWGYLTSQIDDKYNDVVATDIPPHNPELFNRMNLYSSGGTEVLGVQIPNPKGFTEAFANKYKDRIDNELIPSGNFIVKVDFEESYFGHQELYWKIILNNFKAEGSELIDELGEALIVPEKDDDGVLITEILHTT